MILPPCCLCQVRTRLHGGWTRYEGQAQRWFLVHFYGDDAEINLETEHKEFKVGGLEGRRAWTAPVLCSGHMQMSRGFVGVGGLGPTTSPQFGYSTNSSRWAQHRLGWALVACVHVSASRATWPA